MKSETRSKKNVLFNNNQSCKKENNNNGDKCPHTHTILLFQPLKPTSSDVRVELCPLKEENIIFIALHS